MPTTENQETQATDHESFDDAYNKDTVEIEQDPIVVEDVAAKGESTEKDKEQPEAETDEESAEAATVGEIEKGSEEYTQLLDKFAKRMGKDLTDPTQRKDVETVADKEIFIEKIKAENKQLREKLASDKGDETEALTDFEKELLQADEGDGAEQKTKTEDKAHAEPAKTTAAVGENWKSPQDVYTDELNAWQEATKKGDFRKIHEVRQAVFLGQLAGNADIIEEIVDQRIAKQFGKVLPQVEKVAARTQRDEARELAYADLAKLTDYADIGDLATVRDGSPLKGPNGKTYPNTVLNEVLLDNPELLDIRVDHEDPLTADRLTYTKILKAAHRLHKRSTGDKGKSKRLLDAGRKIEERRQQENSRQALNRSTGATGATGSQEPDYVDQMRAARGGRKRMADIKVERP